MRSAYSAIARCYDKFNEEVDYESWADFIAGFFRRGATILDLACGTGNMTLPLAARGFDMIGTDLSCDMLAQARQKAEHAGYDILFLNQNMTCLDLYGTVDGAVCCLDSVNYLTDEDMLYACFSSVYKFLAPGARFLFDVNTPFRFEHIYADRHYVLEDDGVLVAWRNDYDQESGLCSFVLDVFSETENGLYRRDTEDQTERCYSMHTLTAAARDCGFVVEDVYGGFDRREAADTDERWYFVLKKEKQD